MALTLEQVEDRLKAIEGETRKLKADPQGRNTSDPTLALSRDLVDLGGTPSIRMRQTSAQTLTTGTSTQITLQVTDWDTMNGADLTNDEIIIRRSGLYLVMGGVRFVTDNAGARMVGWSVNDDSVDRLRAGFISSSGSTSRPSFCDIGSFKVGDTVQLRGFHVKGSNLDTSPVSATDGMPYIALVLVADLPSNLA